VCSGKAGAYRRKSHRTPGAYYQGDFLFSTKLPIGSSVTGRMLSLGKSQLMRQTLKKSEPISESKGK